MEEEFKGDFCRLHFRVKSNTTFGQAIGISGNCYVLGNNQKQRVVTLVTTPQSYPIWYSAEPLIIPRGETISYRYALLEGGTVKAFEKVIEPRLLTLESLDTIIEDEFNDSGTEGFGYDSQIKLFDEMKKMKDMTKSDENQSNAKSKLAINSTNSNLFLVCYHLPITIKRTENLNEPFFIDWNESILAKSKNSISEEMKTTWIGTIKASIDIITEAEKEYLTEKLQAMNCIPVFLDDAIVDLAYYGYCKKILWPLFHNVDQLDQIHAAWNLHPEDYVTVETSSESKSRHPSRSDMKEALNGGMLSPTTQSSNSNQNINNKYNNGIENPVLEWNTMEEAYHTAHQQVNQEFARLLLNLIHHEDVVWVHDYHLITLPKFLRSSVSKNVKEDQFKYKHVPNLTDDPYFIALPKDPEVKTIRIVFFMHIPFPISIIFATLPRASELLDSMISADVIGFHSFDHARHFLTAAKRTLGLQSESKLGGMLSLTVQDREVIISVSHVSIETDRIADAVRHPETIRIAAELRAKYINKKVVVGVDVCQRLSGVALKLSAFDKFLSDSSWGKKGNIVLVQCCEKSGSRPGDETATSIELKKMVNVINTKYASTTAAYFARKQFYKSDSLSDDQLNLEEPSIRPFSYNNQQQQSSSSSSSVSSSIISPIASPLSPGSPVTQHPSTPVFMPSSVSLSSSPPPPAALSSSPPPSAALSSSPPPSAALSSSPPPPPALSSSSSTVPVVIDYHEVTKIDLHYRVALWLIADILLLTPIREGLNLMPLEYIFARKDLVNAGVVVVSEFSTCSALLNGSLKINPFDPLRVADTIEKGLMLDTKDKDYRRQRDLPFISTHPSSLWTQQIMHDIEVLRSSPVSAIPYPLPLDLIHTMDCYRLAKSNAGITKAGSRLFIFDYGGTLLFKEKHDIYIKRQTLSAISGRKPTDEVMYALQELSNDPYNIVVVVTGLTKLKLGDTFKGMNNITVVTSNGLVYSWGANLIPRPHVAYKSKTHSRDEATDETILTRIPNLRFPDTIEEENEDEKDSVWTLKNGDDGDETYVSQPISTTVTSENNPPSSPSLLACHEKEAMRNRSKSYLLVESLEDADREWDCLDSNVDWQMVSDISIPIITKYTYRTNGTCQTPRIPGIGWSYFGADPEWGLRQATQLKFELEAALAHHDVKVASLIQGSIEVVPRSLHKGLFIHQLLQKVMNIRGGRLPGFVLLIGDEESDDKMIEALYEIIAHAPPHSDVRRCKTFSVNVGKRLCPAQFHVNNVDDVEHVLTSLANCTD